MRVALTTVTALADLGLALFAVWCWVLFDGPDRAAFGLLAAGSLTGAVLLATVAWAKSQVKIRLAYALACARAAGVPVAAAALAVTVSPAAVIGWFTTPIVLIAAVDALVAVVVAGTTRRAGQRMGLPPVTGRTAPEM